MLWVKNIHFGSPLDPSQTIATEAKQRYVYSILKKFQMASQAVTERGKAEVRILDFKTTWSEFQKPGQTAAKRVYIAQLSLDQ